MSTKSISGSTISIRIALVTHSSNNTTSVVELSGKIKKYASHITIINNSPTKNIEEVSPEKKERSSSQSNYIGKGNTLTNAASFDKAMRAGCTHVLSIGSDTGNVQEDLFSILKNIKEAPNTIWIGNRTLSNGNSHNASRRICNSEKITNLWYRLLTGIRLHDTLCDFRAYPIQKVLELQCRGKQFDWEQYVLVAAAWNGIPISELPIHASGRTRNIIFSPARGFFCSIKVFAGLTVKKLFLPAEILKLPGATWRKQIVALIKHEMRAHTTPNKAACSVALGVCMGLSPLHGFQMAILLPMSYFFRLNRPLAILGVNISCPPLIPFVIAVEIAIGNLIIPADFALVSLNGAKANIFTHGFAAFLVGSSILSIAGGITTFLLTKPLFSHFIKSRVNKRSE